MCTSFENPFGPSKEQRESKQCESKQCESKQCEKREIRQNCRSQLQLIRNIIREPNTVHLKDDLCKRAGIILQAESLCLDEASKSRPIFFDPYKDELDDLTEPDYDPHEYDEKWHERNQAGSLNLFLECYISLHDPKAIAGSYYTSWDSLDCHDLFEAHETYLDITWTATGLMLAVQCLDKSNPNPHLPHVRCMIQSDAIGDTRLLRGEILLITRLMMSRLQAEDVESHLMAPILVFSVMGPWNFRVLEAYFNGYNLVVRSTPLYDMRERRADHDFLQNLTRWWFGYCVGDTTALPVKSVKQ